jgi:DivIVA domain-containing protein
MTPEEVRRARFPEAFRGYRPEDVDALLERVATQIEAGQSFLATIEAAMPLPRSIRGYSVDDVDRFLTALGGSTWGRREDGSEEGQHLSTANVDAPGDEVSDVWLTTDNHHILRSRSEPEASCASWDGVTPANGSSGHSLGSCTGSSTDISGRSRSTSGGSGAGSSCPMVAWCTPGSTPHTARPARLGTGLPIESGRPIPKAPDADSGAVPHRSHAV